MQSQLSITQELVFFVEQCNLLFKGNWIFCAVKVFTTCWVWFFVCISPYLVPPFCKIFLPLPWMRNLKQDSQFSGAMTYTKDFSNSELTNIPVVATDATRLYLKNNSLTTVPTVTFINLTNLEILELSENQISIIEHDAFVGLTKLLNLDLRLNALTNLTNDIFHNLTRLTLLYLSHNYLSLIVPQAFRGLGNLRQIWLGHNEMASITSAIFQHLPNLINLFQAMRY